MDVLVDVLVDVGRHWKPDLLKKKKASSLNPLAGLKPWRERNFPSLTSSFKLLISSFSYCS